MVVRTASDDRETLVGFVDAYVPSFEAWDVLMYFAAHPDGPVGPDDLARNIGRRPGDLAAAALQLAEQGVLEPGPDGTWYLSEGSEFRHGLRVFTEAIGDQRRRLLVLTHLLQNLSR